MPTDPISVSEMRERYLRLYSGAANDILRFEYKMHTALPSEFAPLDRGMKLAGQAFLTAGVTIGRGSVIGAGSVVTRSIPPRSIAVGSPARVIRR